MTHLSLWQVRVVSGSERVESVPIPEKIKEKTLFFCPENSYLLLVVAPQRDALTILQTDKIRSTTSFASVFASFDNLTPRGLRSSFGDFCGGGHDIRLFLFNGKAATPATTALATLATVRLEKWLKTSKDASVSFLLGGFFVREAKVKCGNLIQLVSSKSGSSGEAHFTTKTLKFLSEVCRPLFSRCVTPPHGVFPMDVFLAAQSEDTNPRSLKHSSKLLGKSDKVKSQGVSEPLKSIALSESKWGSEGPSQQLPQSEQKASRNFNLNLDKIRLSDSYEEDPDARETDRKLNKLEEFRHACSDVFQGRLFLSGISVAHSLETLEEMGIRNILNCAGDYCLNKFPNQLNYRTYFVKDSKLENIECIFYDCFQFIEDCLAKGGRVLVHCVQGISRSVTIVTAYLMLKLKLTYVEAFERVKASRGIASPNIGFIVQLMAFQRRIQRDFDSGQVKVFCVGSHQLEDPKSIVTRYVN
jgi:hypothetical protein